MKRRLSKLLLNVDLTSRRLTRPVSASARYRSTKNEFFSLK